MQEFEKSESGKVSIDTAFEAIIGLIILAGLVAIGVPIGVGFLVNVTLASGANAALVTLFTSLGSFVVAIVGIYILLKYVTSQVK